MLDGDTCRLAALRVYQAQIRDMDGGFLLHNAALGVLGAGLHALRDHVPAFDDSLLLLDEHLEDLALLAFVLTGKDDDLVTFSNM